MGTTEPIVTDPTVVPELDADSDALFEVLANSRRRIVLARLHECGVPLALADLADEVAVWEFETAITEIPAEEVKSIYLSLYHAHVPKMDDLGVVEYSQERDLVRLLEEYEDLASVIEVPSVR